MLAQAKVILSKSKLGFLGKMAEADLDRTLQILYEKSVARYEAQIEEASLNNKALKAKIAQLEAELAKRNG